MADTAPARGRRDLEVAYGEAQALFGVSFDVPRGLGHRGARRERRRASASLAAAIAGVVPPRAGTGRVRRHRHHRLAAAHDPRKLGLAYVPEVAQPFPHLSVQRQPLGAAPLLGAAPTSARPRSTSAFEMFPSSPSGAAQQAGTLSGGEQQMLALARVLAAPPKLLIADEMSLGLAPMMVDLVFESLERASDEGVTVCSSSSSSTAHSGSPSECVILRQGSVAWAGPADEAGRRCSTATSARPPTR